MIDESLDTESMKQDPQPWEFRSHPAWQRLLVMAGGVLNNFLFAILAYILILDIWGDTYLRNEGNAIYVNDLAYEMGFRTGDRILRFDDYVPDDFMNLQVDLARRDVRKATVLRGTDTLDIYIDQSYIGDVLNTPGMFDLAIPFVVDTIPPQSPNAGLLTHGDHIISVDGQPVTYLQEARLLFGAHAGGEVPVDITRGADTLQAVLQVDTTGRVGVYPRRHAADGGLQVRGQFHRHRPGVPGRVGLVPVPHAAGPAVHHAGRDEPPADSGPGRRPHRHLPL